MMRDYETNRRQAVDEIRSSFDFEVQLAYLPPAWPAESCEPYVTVDVWDRRLPKKELDRRRRQLT